MITTTLIVLVVIAIAAVTAMALFATYNRIGRLNNEIDQAQANIQVELRRQVDILDNVVDSVLKYTDHERETLTGVIEARQSVAGASSPSKAAAATGAVDRQARTLFRLSERYPKLQSDGQFTQLNAQFEDTANRVGATRRYHNQVVNAYNSAITTLPGSMFRTLLHAEQREYIADDAVDPEGPRFNMRGPETPTAKVR